jgi:hypothetical protein
MKLRRTIFGLIVSEMVEERNFEVFSEITQEPSVE